jgi:hypothetical protein
MTPINLTIFCRSPPGFPEPAYVGSRITFRRLSVLSVSLPRNEPGPVGDGYFRSPYAPPGTPHPTYEGTYPQAPLSPWVPWVQPRISVGYDTSQRRSVDPSPCSEYVPSYSVQSTNEPYPLGFRCQRSPGPMTEPRPTSQGSAYVQNAYESRGSYLKVFLNALFCNNV